MTKPLSDSGTDVSDPGRLFFGGAGAGAVVHASVSSPSLNGPVEWPAHGWNGVDRRATPLQTLSESLRSAAQSNANSLVLYAKAAAKSNPDVARLVSGYETWENNLKAEATRRLGTFQAPTSLLTKGGLLSEDWDLLKRVKHSGTLTVASMKRSASETDLEQMTPGNSASPAWKQSPGWVVDHQQQDQHTYEYHGEYDLFNRPMPRIVLPKVSTAPALSDSLGVAGNAASSGALFGVGDSGVSSAAARNLEAVASSLLAQVSAHSRLAIQSAQQSIQQTAANCQQNLQALSNVLHANVAQGGLAVGLSSTKALVPWQISSGGASSEHGSSGGLVLQGDGTVTSDTSNEPDNRQSLSGALVPWSVFPRYLRAKEQEANWADVTEEHKENQQEWYAPFEKYIDSLEQAPQRRKYHSLREPGRQVAIVTTAALPWLTGTSVNPLLRAAYLSTDADRKVTLVLPWLSKVDQERIFPNHVSFDTPEDQENFVREWARKRTGLDCNFKITFYPGRYAAEKGSILPVGDITTCIPDHEADVAVLEEPEHLNWYHHGRRWTDKFKHVVGVMHTNYLDYARREEGGHIKEALLKHINAWMCRIYCHKVIKLSDAVQPLPRQETMFVHGVSPSFLRVGETKALQVRQGAEAWTNGVYFLGKVLWAKGYTELLDRLKEHVAATGENIPVDVYGAGPDLKAVEEEAQRRQLSLRFNGARDHADPSLHNYKVFVNPSLSDVVATTTAEALAMGKYVVCADHPSNKFFEQFPNCLIYRDSKEFSAQLNKALTTDPTPLSPDQLHKLTWEAATDRFLEVGELRREANPLEAALDNVLAAAHQALTGMEQLRVVAGAGANTRDMPARITDYQPTESDVGGLFDDKSRARRIYGADKAEKAQKKKAAAEDNAAGPGAGTAAGAASAEVGDTKK